MFDDFDDLKAHAQAMGFDKLEVYMRPSGGDIAFDVAIWKLWRDGGCLADAWALKDGQTLADLAPTIDAEVRQAIIKAA